MASIQMETIVQGVTILGGVVALLLAGLQDVETSLDISKNAVGNVVERTDQSA